MPVINIQGTIINFPDSAQSPNWAEPIIQFAEAVAQALSTVTGPFDVPPQIYTLISNGNTNIALPSLTFPTADVRGAFIDYTVFRSSMGVGAVTLSDAGTLVVNYNPNGPIGHKWDISNEHNTLTGVTFTITDQGQVEFSSTVISGSSAVGFIGYTAKALQQG